MLLDPPRTRLVSTGLTVKSPFALGELARIIQVAPVGCSWTKRWIVASDRMSQARSSWPAQGFLSPRRLMMQARRRGDRLEGIFRKGANGRL